jgi:hypothetical protein
MTVLRIVVLIALALVLALPAGRGDAAASDRVPFVACASDGQAGPRPGPKDSGHAPAVAPSLAGKLAYYASADLSVLAPRGWHCIGLYGSNGATLVVTPEAHQAADVLKPNFHLTGPAVELSLSLGSTSGRFEVAQVAARLFPSQRAFVQRIIAEGIEPASDFPFGPYPADKLTRRSNTDVEFQTPAHADGMGTTSFLAKNASPISGVAIMTARGDLVVVDVRTPPGSSDVTASVVAQTRAASSSL